MKDCELLAFCHPHDIIWIKVPSHVNVEGNEQANTLAKEGRVKNFLYPLKHTPRDNPL